MGDLNGDGIADIAVAATSKPTLARSTVLLGKGDGTFTALAPLALDSDDGGLPAADRSRSATSTTTARPTWWSAAPRHGDVTVLLGDGDGTFRLGSQDSNGNQGATAGLADVDGDGRTDILAPGATSRRSSPPMPGWTCC